jgi:alpha-beta hydrolase superfamily lysophospholipase
VQKLLLSTLPRLAPNLRIGNGLQVDYISHDRAVVDAYVADPLCHDRISARLAQFIADGGPATLARAAHWSVPTLLMGLAPTAWCNPQAATPLPPLRQRARAQPVL